MASDGAFPSFPGLTETGSCSLFPVFCEKAEYPDTIRSINRNYEVAFNLNKFILIIFFIQLNYWSLYRLHL